MKKVILLLLIVLFNLSYAEQPKVGLVLSGGGAKGFAHIGVLKVLERENVKVDYISGTSIGALIGALYSLGYTPDQLEDIVLRTDWIELLSEEISRENMSITKKMETPLPITLPMEGWDLKIPQGLIEGQKIEMLIHELTWGNFGYQDFKEFPIPFVCVATNIENGSPVVIDEGNLTKALRATMSIPTVFTPVLYKGELLVDGMISQNLPVKEVIDMGAEKVISIDVGQELYPKEKLNTASLILEQSFNIKGALGAKEQRKLTDILIVPNLKGYNSTSYKNKKNLIDLGEKAAEEKLSEIRKYSEEDNYSSQKLKITRISQNDPRIKRIEITGNNSIKEEKILNLIDIKVPLTLTKEEVNSIIKKIYNEGKFKKVSYNIEEDVLKIKVKENGTSFLSLGGNYNGYTKASLYANLKRNNYLKFNNTLNLGVKLGEYPEGVLNYTKKNSVFSAGKMFYEISYSSLPVYRYINNRRTAKFEYWQILNKEEYQLELKKDILLRLGVEAKFVKGKTIIGDEDYKDIKSRGLNGYFEMDVDTTEKKFFFKKGLRLNLKTKVGNPSFDFIQYIFKINKPVQITEKLTARLGMKLGEIVGDDIPDNEKFLLGGIHSSFDSQFIFEGLEPFEIMTENINILNQEFEYEFNRNRFLALQLNQGIYKDGTKSNYIYSFGFNLGAMTGIGPINFGIFRNINSNSYIGYLDIGYRF